MNRQSEKSRLEIRRILVTLDASRQSILRVEAAAELASDLQAELFGLFVEDANLLRMAELPFVREFNGLSPIGRRIEAEVLKQDLRVQSDRMRRILAEAAAARGVPWTFRVARGSVATEVLSAASEADLIIVGKMSWDPAGGRRLGSTVRMILSHGRGMTMVVQEEMRRTAPVSLIFDGSDLSEKAAQVAVHLTRIRKSLLNVFILAPDRGKAEDYQARLSGELHAEQIRGKFYYIINPSLRRIAWFAQTYGEGPMVLPCGGTLLQGDALCSLVSEVRNPVLLVR